MPHNTIHKIHSKFCKKEINHKDDNIHYHLVSNAFETKFNLDIKCYFPKYDGIFVKATIGMEETLSWAYTCVSPCTQASVFMFMCLYILVF